MAIHAGRLAQQGLSEEAFAACELIEGDWHDECVFQTSDALELIGEAAWTRCRTAGRYENQCAGHAATRMVAAMDDLPLEVGQENELVRELTSRIQAMPIRDRQTVNRTGVARHIAARWDGVPFEAAGCGVLPIEPCSLAYAETMRQDASIDRDAACAEPRTSESIIVAGGKGWTPDSDSVAQRAWRDLCSSWSGEGARPAGGPPPPGAGPARR